MLRSEPMKTKTTCRHAFFAGTSIHARESCGAARRSFFVLFRALTCFVLSACTRDPSGSERGPVIAESVRAQTLVPCQQADNPIQCENAQQGTSDWTLTAPAP